MLRIIRKITPSKWRGAGWASVDRLPADALTLCTRTSGNTLSFWRYGGGLATKDDALLALMGSMNRIETFHYLDFSIDEFPFISFSSTDGVTMFEELKGLHVDMADIDHEVLLTVGRKIAQRIYDSSNIGTVKKLQFRELIQGALDTGRIDWEKVPDDMISALKR